MHATSGTADTLKSEAEQSRFDCTRVLIAVNVIVFVAMVAASGWKTFIIPSHDVLVRWGANIGALVVAGQYWRLITSMFIHASILHLGLNMYALWMFGPMVDSKYGAWRFMTIYFFSGIFGALASMVWNPTQISAGASGALVGIAGAMLALLVCNTSSEDRRDRYMHPLIFFAVICASLLYGFFVPDIDNAAHIGGLAGGFICGLILQPRKNSTGKFDDLFKVGFTIVILLLVFLACLHAARADRRSDTYRIATSAMDHLRAHEFEQAYSDYDKLLKFEISSTYFVGRAAALSGMKQFKRALSDSDRAIAADPKDQNAYLSRARALHDLHQYDESIKTISKVILANPLIAPAYNSRAWSELALGRYRQALSDANRSIALAPDVEESLDTRGLAYFCLNEVERALKDYAKGSKLKPEDGACHYHRAMIYEALGQQRDAAREFALARHLGYAPEPWETKLRRVGNAS